MSLNVLVVDDSDIMRKVIKRVLSLAGFEVDAIHEAGDGQQALDVLDANWIDIVLTDINMPVMTGSELLNRMKQSDDMKNIPVIMVSTEAREDRIDEIMNAGAAGFISKPFKPEDVRDIICSSLGVSINERFVEEPEDSDF